MQIFFMAEFEQKYNHPLKEAKWIRFLRDIDDIFMVWTKSERKLQDFINELTEKHCSINFVYKFDCKEIESIHINKLNYELLFCENQVTVKFSLMRNWNIRTH